MKELEQLLVEAGQLVNRAADAIDRGEIGLKEAEILLASTSFAYRKLTRYIIKENAWSDWYRFWVD